MVVAGFSPGVCVGGGIDGICVKCQCHKKHFFGGRVSEEAEGSRRLSRAISTTEGLIPAAGAQARLQRGLGDRPESQDTQKN